jgi:hypothetical protein
MGSQLSGQLVSITFGMFRPRSSAFEFAGNAAEGRHDLPRVAPGQQPPRDRLSRNRFLAAPVNPCPARPASDTDGTRIADRGVNSIEGITGSSASGWGRA